MDVRSLGSQRPQRGEGSAGEHGGRLGYIPTLLALLKVAPVSILRVVTVRAVIVVVTLVVEAERKLKLRRRKRTDPQNLSSDFIHSHSYTYSNFVHLTGLF